MSHMLYRVFEGTSWRSSQTNEEIKREQEVENGNSNFRKAGTREQKLQFSKKRRKQLKCIQLIKSSIDKIYEEIRKIIEVILKGLISRINRTKKEEILDFLYIIEYIRLSAISRNEDISSYRKKYDVTKK